jgi:acyl dehydratase
MSPSAKADIAQVRLGDSASVEFVVTEQLIDRFVEFSSDTNSLHVHDDFAQAHGYRGRVAHGLIALSAISRLIGTQLPGHGSLWIAQDVQFTQPTLIGDRLEAKVTVEKVSSAAQVVILKTEVVNLDTRAVVLRGTAKVRVPNHAGGV